jgi:nitrilase
MAPVTTTPVIVAAVQAAPVLLDREATIGKVVKLAEKAAASRSDVLRLAVDTTPRTAVWFGSRDAAADPPALLVDTSPRPAVIETSGAAADGASADLAARTHEPREA